MQYIYSLLGLKPKVKYMSFNKFKWHKKRGIFLFPFFNPPLFVE